MELAIASKESRYQEEGWRVRKDGTRFYASVSITALRDHTGHLRGYAKVTRDITERQMAHEALERLNIELEKRVAERTSTLEEANTALRKEVAERHRAEVTAMMATKAKSDFLANVSHEIRTPMTAILGFTDLLADDSGMVTREERQHAAQTIRRSSEHLLSLINDVLDLSSIEAGKMQLERRLCSPARLASYAVSLMKPKAVAKNIALDVHFCTPLPATSTATPLACAKC